LKLHHSIWLLLPLALAFSGCSSPDAVREERIKKAKMDTGDIVVGVTWPESQLVSDFHNGLRMALEEVNSQGLYNGRRIRVDARDNEGDADVSKNIDLEFAHKTDLVAVIGHFDSGLALSTSVTAEQYGFLFLTPGSLLYELGLHKFSTFFRSIPNSMQIGHKAADYTYNLGFKKPVIVWVRSAYGKSLYTIYRSELAKLGIDAVATFSFFPWENKDFRVITTQLRTMDFDMIFLAFPLPSAAWFMRDCRGEGINQPFLGVNLLADRLVKEMGVDQRGIYTVANYDPDNDNPISQDFVARFKAKYGHVPDVWGAQGYDNIMLLADLIRKYKTSNPAELALNLRYLENWQGVTGVHSFNRRGEVVTKPLYLGEYDTGHIRIIDIDTLNQADMYSVLNFKLRSQLERGNLGLFDNAGNVTVLLPDETIFSGFGGYNISVIGDSLMRTVATELKNKPEYFVDFEGYSESSLGMSDGGGAINDSLMSINLRKSAAMARYLYSLGVERSRVRITGRGFTKATAASEQYGTRVSFKNRIEMTLVHENSWDQDKKAKEALNEEE
jgi:branched-chain amino acid transport system substrate-binding protein